MKKLKRKRGQHVQTYEFTDYAGEKVMTNNQACLHLFGSKEPDAATIELITTILNEPDFIFAPLGSTYPSYHYFKCINGFDYVIETKPGYGVINNSIDNTRRAILGMRKNKMSDSFRRDLFARIRLVVTGLKFFEYTADFFPS